jgi:hypothetical protein
VWHFFKLLLLGLFLPLFFQAQTVPSVLEYYSTSRGGGVHRVVARGEFLYVAEGSSLVVYDTRTAPYPRVFEKRFCSPVTDLCFHKGFLYVLANHDGLSKWDVSIPIKPGLVGEYRPTDFFTAFESLRFSGDSLLVAATSAVWMMKEATGIGPAFEKIGQFAEQMEGRGRVVAGEVLGTHYIAAITGKEKGIGQGIHAFAIRPETRLNFHHYDAGETVGLLRIGMTHRVVVFGGRSRTGESHLMVLDFSDPSHPKWEWADTVRGDAGSEVAVENGLLQGDTLWVPVAGRLGGICESAAGSVAVYRMNTEGRPDYVGQIVLPAAPRHIAVSGKKFHVALGDGGLVTYDLGKWKPGQCEPLPEVGHHQRGSGYCRGADVAGDKLITANGKSGAVLHLIQDRKTIATRTFDGLGKVDQVRFLADGLHVVCWIAAPNGDSLVVIQLADGKLISSLGGTFGHRQVVAWQDRIVCARDDKTGFDILDLRNPQKPKKEQTVLLNFNDLALDPLGRLIVSTEHNIRVFDLGTGFTELATLARWGEGYGAVAGDGAAFYVISTKRGLIRYRLLKDSRGYSLKEELVGKTPYPHPQKLVVDNLGVYLAYDNYGIFALDKERFEIQGYYRTGLNFRAMDTEGLRDVFCREGKILVVEYYGQVTVLKRTDVEE